MYNNYKESMIDHFPRAVHCYITLHSLHMMQMLVPQTKVAFLLQQK
jgi:hypothetical protein